MTQENQIETSLLPFPVSLNGKAAYINKHGNIILKTDFDRDSSSIFSEGLVAFEENGKFGFIDETGKIVINPSFEHAQGFSEGVAPVFSDKKWGFIDKSGKIIIQPLYDEVREFKNGLALVFRENGTDKIGLPKYKSGFINKTGKMVVGNTKDKHTGKFDETEEFSEGLAVVRIGERYGYVNEKDQTVIKFRFKEAKSFSEGLAPVTINGRTWGFIDITGQFVIQPKFFSADIFSEGLAAVSVNKSDFDRTGFIDKSGNLVFKTPAASFMIGEFSNGRATFFSKNGGGYIDKKGQVIFQEKDVLTTKFKDGIGAVFTKDSGVSYINKSGKYIWNSKEQN